LTLALLVCGGAAASPVLQAETVERRVLSAGGFGWKAGYDAEVRDGAVWVRVAVHLVPAPGVTRPEVDRAAAGWKKAIEERWSNRLALELPSGERLPVRVEVSFWGPRVHHEVVVSRTGHRVDELHWLLVDRPGLIAHEFGHMLGAFDDYEGGAVGPRGAAVDRESVMRSGPDRGVARPRHLEGIGAWFTERTGLAARVVEWPGTPDGIDGANAPALAGSLQHEDRP
jgi:hypothetical protein